MPGLKGLIDESQPGRVKRMEQQVIPRLGIKGQDQGLNGPPRPIISLGQLIGMSPEQKIGLILSWAPLIAISHDL